MVPKVLLVVLPVAGILVQHVGGASLYLALNDRTPHILSLHRLPGSALSYLIHSFKLISPNISQTRTHQGLVSISSHPLHEQIWNPHAVHQIPGALFLLAVVLKKIQAVKRYLRAMAQGRWRRLKPLVATLVHVPGGVVEHPQHRHQAVDVPIGTCNICPGSSDAIPPAEMSEHCLRVS